MLVDIQELTQSDCRAVLEKAKPDFLEIINKLCDRRSKTLEPAQSTFVVYYLEAVIILQHLQRPSVVQSMTVSVTVLFWSLIN